MLLDVNQFLESTPFKLHDLYYHIYMYLAILIKCNEIFLIFRIIEGGGKRKGWIDFVLATGCCTIPDFTFLGFFLSAIIRS